MRSSDPDSRSPSSQTPDKPRWLRLGWPVLAWLLFLAWSNIPPYRMHINGVRWGDSSFAWHWKLYHQGGLGACEVRYFDMHADGAPIKRWELFGYERPGDMPDNIARTPRKQLRPAYNQVCDALKKQGDPDPYVEVFARCGEWMGWKVVERRRRNVCIDPTKQRKKSKAKPKARSSRGGKAK